MMILCSITDANSSGGAISIKLSVPKTSFDNATLQQKLRVL